MWRRRHGWGERHSLISIYELQNQASYKELRNLSWFGDEKNKHFWVAFHSKTSLACGPHPVWRKVDSVSDAGVRLVPALSNQFAVHIFPVGIKYVLSPVVLLKGREEARSFLLLKTFCLIAWSICCLERGRAEQLNLIVLPRANAELCVEAGSIPKSKWAGEGYRNSVGKRGRGGIHNVPSVPHHCTLGIVLQPGLLS